MNVITDGKGSGYSAEVTANHRLKTTGVDLTLTEAASETGDTYNLNTGTIALTSASESALFYVKNNEGTNLIIESIIINFKDYVGTAGQPTLHVYRNPSTGTIISNAVAGVQSNRNYGSKKALDIDIFQGANGNTMNTGDSQVEVFLPSTAALTFVEFSTIVVLPKGAAIGISYEPPSGMTSMNIVAAFNVTLNGTQL